MTPAVVLLIALVGAADENVCVPSADGTAWVCGTRDNPPEQPERLFDPVSEKTEPEDQALEVFPIPNPVPVNQRAIPGSPLIQSAPQAAPEEPASTASTADAEAAASGTPEGGYTLLLASLTSVSDLINFAEDFEVNKSKAARIPVVVDGNPRHILVYGRYLSEQAARLASESLPPVLRSMRPTPVPLSIYANDPVPLNESDRANTAVASVIDTPMAEATVQPEESSAPLPAPQPEPEPASKPITEPAEAARSSAAIAQAQPVPPITAPDEAPDTQPTTVPQEPEAATPVPIQRGQSADDFTADEAAGMAVNDPFALPSAPEQRKAKMAEPAASGWGGLAEMRRLEGDYTVQVALRDSRADARRFAEALGLDPGQTFIVDYRGRVMIALGRFSTLSQANAALARLPELDNPAWVRRVKPIVR